METPSTTHQRRLKKAANHYYSVVFPTSAVLFEQGKLYFDVALEAIKSLFDRPDPTSFGFVNVTRMYACIIHLLVL